MPTSLPASSTRDSGAEQKRLANMVGHDHDGLPEILLQLLEFALDFGTGERIERAEGLVHQQNGRIGSERPGDPDALSLSAGKFVGIAARIFVGLSPTSASKCRNARTNALFRPTFQTRQQRNIFFDGVVREEADVLNHVPDLAAQGDRVPVQRGAAVDAHFAARWFQHAIDELQCR